MERTNVHKTDELICFNHQQAIPPSHAVWEAYISHANHMPTACKHTFHGVEEAVRKLIPASSHRFHLLPYFPHALMILTSLLLNHRETFQGRNHLLLSSHEQQYVIDAFTQRRDSSYDWVPIDRQGTISYERLSEALTSRTLLFSLSAANGMTGLLEPIQDIQSLCRERGVLLHLDLSDALGRVPLTPEILSADILTISSLAIGGMSSIGAMLIQPKLSDLLFKWFPASQPFFPRDLVAMRQACIERYDSLPSLALSSIRWKKNLQQTLQGAIPDIQFLLQEKTPRLPNIMICAIPNIPAESLAFFLEQHHICVSTGLGRFQPLSQVLQACGISPFLCHSALHLSCTESPSKEHIDRLVQTIRQGIDHLQPAMMSYT